MANLVNQVSEPGVCVVMTGLDPDLHFDKHKALIHASRWVLKYGLRLLAQLHEGHNPTPYKVARKMGGRTDNRPA